MMNQTIDTSVFAGHWPFRRLAHTSPTQLKQYLSERGVQQAWVSSAEAIMYPDPMQGNHPLLADITGDPFFLPVALIDPTLATWHQDAKCCVATLGCRAFKITPNYHSYSLEHPAVAALSDLASELELPLCIQVRMMDERGHHPLVKVPPVPVSEIKGLATRHARTRFLVCGIYVRELPTLANTNNVWCEISYCEAAPTMRAATDHFPWRRLVFGSHSPLLCFEGAAGKLLAPAEDLPAEQVRAIRIGNARSLLAANQ